MNWSHTTCYSVKTNISLGGEGVGRKLENSLRYGSIQQRRNMQYRCKSNHSIYSRFVQFINTMQVYSLYIWIDSCPVLGNATGSVNHFMLFSTTAMNSMKIQRYNPSCNHSYLEEENITALSPTKELQRLIMSWRKTTVDKKEYDPPSNIMLLENILICKIWNWVTNFSCAASSFQIVILHFLWDTFKALLKLPCFGMFTLVGSTWILLKNQDFGNK